MFATLLEQIVGIVWNWPVTILCLFSGVFFTVYRMKFIQFRCIPHAIELLRGRYDNPKETGQITHFQALSAALSGTIGLGNIAGVAIAIALGGPGAVFWMWIIGIFGMATKYVECTLGTHYREENPQTGEVRGGPMYYIKKGLGQKWMPMAMLYGTGTIFAAMGAGGMFQANQAASALNEYYAVPTAVTGLILAILVGLVIIGGIKRIGKVASRIVPAMCIIYVIGALIINIINFDKLPFVLWTIVSDAFSAQATIGGTVGTVIMMGVRRAIFSNEAGLGSASIAHAAVRTNYPVREGIVAAMGPMIDTIIVCSATASVIILSGFYGTGMFVNSGPDQITFNTANTIQLEQGWSVTDTGVPAETEKTRRYREGQFALHYDGNGTSATAITDPITIMTPDNNRNPKLAGQALRFSAYHTGVDALEIIIRNSKQEKIGSLSLKEGQSSISTTLPDGQTQDIMTIVGSKKANRWKSKIIQFEPGFEQWAANNDLQKIQLEFVAPPGSQAMFIDRIELVSKLSDIALTIRAFDEFFHGFGTIFITFSVLLFAFSTMISWCYYGETASVFLGGRRLIQPFKWAFVVIIYVGAVNKLSTVLNFSDIMLGLMVIPNTIAIIFLSGKVAKMTDTYFKDLKAGTMTRYK